jgi:hypothetical protein
VFSSSKGDEVSYEDPELENGIFTSQIIKALSNSVSDTDNNGHISLNELKKYVTNTVPEITGKADFGPQHPTVDRDNIFIEMEFDLCK